MSVAPMSHRPREFRARVAACGLVPARGFTMVELMVVLVIIAIVAGLIIVGIRQAIGGAADDSTQTRLEMLDSFMAAYANSENARAGGLGNTKAAALPSALKTNGAAGEFYSTVDNGADPAAAPATTNEALTAPDLSVTPPYLLSDPTRYPAAFNQDNWIHEPAVGRTQAVLRRLLSIPANQSAYASLSDDAKTGPTATGYETNDSILWHVNIDDPVSPLDPPLIVDAYGQVIIFVPRTGLAGLAFKDGSNNVTIRAVDGRAFWASAGQDGMFGGGPGADGVLGTADDLPGADDNVYSTPVIVVPPPTTP